MPEKVSRSCYLKKVVITRLSNPGATSKSLCEYLKTVFTQYPKANDRKLQLSEDKDRYRVMNDWKFLGEQQDMCAASIFAFTLNANQNAAVLSSDDASFPIEVLAPRRDPDHHQEFVEGLAWFATTMDYIAIMAAQTVSFTAIEEYLSWIIGDLLNETVIISFTEPQHISLQNCTMDNVSRISLRSGIDVKESFGQNRSRRSFKASGRGWKILEAVFDAFNKRPPRLPLAAEDALEQVDIDVIISTHRTQAKPGRLNDALNRVADAFKDLDDPPVDIEFKDGRKISLTEYRVKKTFQIESENKIMKPEAVCDILYSWLKSQIATLNLASERTETT